MDRLKRSALLAVLALLAACEPAKPPVPVPEAPMPVPPSATLFPSPYFPAHDVVIAGHRVKDLASDWSSATVYTETQLNAQQKAWVATLEPAGGEGRVADGFTADFDGDGATETVAYGAYAKDNGKQGNFVLVTRRVADKAEVLLLKELPGPPAFTVFTLKPDGSLWFGGGIDAGEVTMRIVWEGYTPVFSLLTQD